MITARADQDVVVVDSGKHMFENYGELDNSLYFETHGVVPDDTTFHCASIDGGRYFRDEIREVDVMIWLGMLPPSGVANIAMKEYVPDVCVREDGSVHDLHTVEFLLQVC